VIAVLHAFSRRNPGDGLLVDLTLERLSRTGIEPSECVVFALNADSFRDLPEVRQIGVARSGVTPRLLPATGQLLEAVVSYAARSRFRLGRLARDIGAVSGIVAVGGGYLRAAGLVSSIGTLINHLPQLALASQAEVPSVYLPQSIGPLAGPVGRAIRILVTGIDLVCCRDDSSVEEVEPSTSARRYPDLAIMKISETLAGTAMRTSGEGNVIVVGRDMGRHREYEERLRDLAHRIPRAIWAVHSESSGRKNDAGFARRLGFDVAGPLTALLNQLPGGVVVSVRLHGALQAILSGWPAVHLSYQRKGYGAFTDLGLSSYVHSALRFNPALVAEQVSNLNDDPTEYWDCVLQRAPWIRAKSDELTNELRATFAR
jgi:polysaccharide pyruvyl transferase WcaK-like protein